MRKMFFMYNPISGSRNLINKLDYIIEKFQSNGVVLHIFRFYPGCEEAMLNILLRNSFECAIFSGGDGTLNACVNILLKNNISLPVGIIPTGTCNDFASCLNIPNNIKKCIDIILNKNLTYVDVGLLNNEKYFLSSCSGGAFVGVSFTTNNDLKKNFGQIAYYIKGISELKNIKPIKVNIKTDNEELFENILLFLILNGKQAAGLTNIAKKAEIADGYMDLLLVKKCSHINLASMFFNILSKQSIDSKFIKLIRTKTCEIKGNNETMVSLDGEKAGYLPIHVNFLKKALGVFVN